MFVIHVNLVLIVMFQVQIVLVCAKSVNLVYFSLHPALHLKCQECYKGTYNVFYGATFC